MKNSSRVQFTKLTSVNDMLMALNALIPSEMEYDDIVFVCVGTDRSTGDSLAPLVGTYLNQLGYHNVYGTIDYPVHAMNLTETIEQLPKDKFVVAIDAGLGQLTSIGTFHVAKGSLKPGAGVNKDLPEIGDAFIMGLVNVGGFMEYFVLQNTRLSLVMKMARDIVSAITIRFPLENEKDEVVKVEHIDGNSYQRFEVGLLV